MALAIDTVASFKDSGQEFHAIVERYIEQRFGV